MMRTDRDQDSGSCCAVASQSHQNCGISISIALNQRKFLCNKKAPYICEDPTFIYILN